MTMCCLGTAHNLLKTFPNIRKYWKTSSEANTAIPSAGTQGPRGQETAVALLHNKHEGCASELWVSQSRDSWRLTSGSARPGKELARGTPWRNPLLNSLQRQGWNGHVIAAVSKLFSDLKHLFERTQWTPLPGNQFLSQWQLCQQYGLVQGEAVSITGPSYELQKNLR